MGGKKRLSLSAACVHVGGYPELLLNLARRHGLEIHQQGRGRYVNRDDLDVLARHVRRVARSASDVAGPRVEFTRWGSSPQLHQPTAQSKRWSLLTGRRWGLNAKKTSCRSLRFRIHGPTSGTQTVA